jgi:PAS domain S-box-containing protein
MQFQDLPIKRKLVVVIFLTSFSVLTLMCIVLLSFEIYSYEQTTRRSLATMADIITANSAAVLIFDDQKMAREILGGLRAEPEVVAAALYKADGTLYATYPGSLGADLLPARPAPDGVTIEWRYLTLYKPVVQGDKRVGTLFLKADLQEMYRRLAVYGAILAVVLAGSAIVALFLSNLFQRRISQPLLELAETAKQLSEKKDYSVRAVKRSRDELGYLTEAFNSMLDQIQAGDSALRQSETRLSAMFNQAGAGIAQTDLAGRFLLVNDRYGEITGRTREELLKLRMQDITHADDQEQDQTLFEDLLQGASAFVVEKRLVRANGEMVWVRSDVAPLRNAAGRVESILSVTQDVTERKRAVEELERARDAAERANRAKDEFLAALSHELRTPLNPVLLLASEAANDARLPAGVRADFDTIAKNVALEARLIDDLLDVTRIVHGKLPLEPRAVDAHQVVADALATVRPDLEQKRITLTVQLEADQHTVLGDAVRLQQVFWNVLKNAIKFTADQGRITVRTSRAPASAELVVAITDTGIGLADGELKGVFEAFQQGEHARNGRSHRFGGLGLGLAISRTLVELHAGRIEAQSEGRGRGATFTITLPLLGTEQAAARDGGPERRSVAPPPSARTGAEPRAILLVEDHDPTRNALAQLLTRRRYEVKSAATATEARELMAGRKFDLLISDIGLPDGSGHDLMREIRLRHPGTPGIALTGYGMERDIAASEASGFAAHLVKPVRVEALDRALAAVTSGAPAGKAEGGERIWTEHP